MFSIRWRWDTRGPARLQHAGRPIPLVALNLYVPNDGTIFISPSLTAHDLKGPASGTVLPGSTPCPDPTDHRQVEANNGRAIKYILIIRLGNARVVRLLNRM